MTFRTISISLFGIGLLVSSHTVQAQSYMVSASCNTDANAYYYGLSDPQSDLHTGPLSANAMTQSSAYYQADPTYPDTGRATATAQGQQGSLKGNVGANTFDSATASANCSLSWTDTLIVTSSTLTVGTPVSISFLTRYRASILNTIQDPLSGGFPSGGTTLVFHSAATDVSPPTPATVNMDYTAQDSITYDYFAQTKIYDILTQRTLSAYVGDSITLTSNMNMSAFVDPGPFQTFKKSLRIAPNDFTSEFYAQAPDGVILDSASGHNYAATPAPPALFTALSGVGLILMGLRSRRKR